MKRTALALVALLLCVSPLHGQIVSQVNGVPIAAGDTLKLTAISSYELPGIGTNTSGSPLIESVLGGVGGIAVGDTITMTGFTSRTVLHVSAQAEQIPTSGAPVVTATTTNTSTTMSGIGTIACARIKAYMLITGVVPGTGVPNHTYTTTDCSGGSLTMSQAATGAVTSATFTPAIIASGNATSSNTAVSMLIKSNAGGTMLGLTVTGDYLSIASPTPTAFSSFSLAPATDRTSSTASSGSLSAGLLTNVVVSITTGTVAVKNAIWVKVELVRSGTVQKMLMQGPISSIAPAYWPGMHDQTPSDTCRMRTFVQARPAVGDESRIPIPANVSWEFRSYEILFGTSSTAADRVPVIQIMNYEGLASYVAAFRGSSHEASSTVLYLASEVGYPMMPDYLLSSGGSGGAYMAIVPAQKLVGGGLASFETATGNLQSGDQWTEPQFTVEECFAQ